PVWSGTLGDPCRRDFSARIERDLPVRRTVVVSDRVCVFALTADAEKLDRFDCTELLMTGLQVRQLLARRVGERGAHLGVVRLAAGNARDKAPEGWLRLRVRDLILHPFGRPALDR